MEMTPEAMDSLIADYLKKKGLPVDPAPAVTFEDVIIKERISSIASRKDIKDLRAQLAKNFWLNIPIVSANMDTVTDARMAIALARLGGMGFIHQFASLENRLSEVVKVKRADNMVIDNPALIAPDATLETAKNLMQELQISSLLVADREGRLVGILTSRDMRFAADLKILVADFMTNMPLVTANVGVSPEEAQGILEQKKIEKLPIMDSQGRPVGLITAKDILKRKQFPNAARDSKGRLVVGATLRFSGNYLEEAEALLTAGADVLLLDTARAGASAFADEGVFKKNVELAAEKTAKIRNKFPNAVLVVGNTSNPEAVALLAKAGADCVKIGVGPGAGCKTQEEAGVGMPQLQAIAECAAVAKELAVYLIGDGGIRKGADLNKAIVGGANAVMIGGLLAGTDESPSLLVWDKSENKLVKKYRGSASLDHQLARIKVGDLDAIRNPEGESGEVPYVGSLASVISGLIGGLRSGMSYTGARNLEEYWQRARFRLRSKAAIEEGKPRI